MTTTPMSPETVTSLVQLRSLLASADRASLSTSPVTRPMAVVLLDAVNERATHFAATFLNLTIPNRAGFEQIMEVVKTALGNRWSSPTWPDIRRLHRTRNLVQHEGLEVDQKNVGVWSSATSSYTRSLVSAVWGVNIDEVMLAEAVRDADLRVLLSEAERSILQDAPADSIRKSKEAFSVAYEHWRKQYRRRTPFHREPMRHEVLDVKGYEYLKKEISEVDDASVAMALSGDPGEYVWFRDATATQEVMQSTTADEAQRALGFVFGWITRWEAFRESFNPERWFQRQVAQRRVRSSAGHARVSDLSVRGGQGKIRVEINLMDVPPNAEFNAWRDTLTQLLNEELKSGGWCKVTESGNLVFHLRQGGDLPADLADTISTALRRVEEVVALERSEAESLRRTLNAEADAYAQSFDAAKERFPSWVNEVWLTRGRVIIAGNQQSRLMFSVTPQAQPHWGKISSGLGGRPDVESCIFASGEGGFLISPEFSVDELCAVLHSISPGIEGLIAEEVESERAQQELRRSLESDLRAKFHL